MVSANLRQEIQELLQDLRFIKTNRTLSVAENRSEEILKQVIKEDDNRESS